MSAAQIVIRRSTREDWFGIEKLYDSLSEDDLEFRFMNPHHLTYKEAKEMVDPQVRTTYVATKGQSIIGEATLEIDGEVSVVVSKKYREEGVGALLLKNLIAVAKGRGLRIVKFFCLPSNQHMIWLGSFLGFKLAKHYETEDEWRLNL